jgi:hypothetical protein
MSGCDSPNTVFLVISCLWYSRKQAIQRIRAHLLEKFHKFKSPMTNIKQKQDVSGFDRLSCCRC